MKESWEAKRSKMRREEEEVEGAVRTETTTKPLGQVP